MPLDFRSLDRARFHSGGLTRAQITQMNIWPREVDEVPAGIQHTDANLDFLRQQRERLFGDVELLIAHLKHEEDYVDLIPGGDINDFADVQKELEGILVDLEAMRKRLCNRRHFLEGKGDFRDMSMKLHQHRREAEKLRRWVGYVSFVVEETRTPGYPKLLQMAETLEMAETETDSEDEEQQDPGPSDHPASSNPGGTANKVVIMVLVMLSLIVIVMFYYWMTGVERQLWLISRLLED